MLRYHHCPRFYGAGGGQIAWETIEEQHTHTRVLLPSALFKSNGSFCPNYEYYYYNFFFKNHTFFASGKNVTFCCCLLVIKCPVTKHFVKRKKSIYLMLFNECLKDLFKNCRNFQVCVGYSALWIRNLLVLDPVFLSLFAGPILHCIF